MFQEKINKRPGIDTGKTDLLVCNLFNIYQTILNHMD